VKPSPGQTDEQNAEVSEESFEVERDDHVRGEGVKLRGEGVKLRGEDVKPSAGRFIFEQAWLVVACVLLIAATVLLYLGYPSAAFVAAALGVSAWFLNVRNGLKRKHDLVKRGGRNWETRSGGD
jgi:Flp pilus assembly protein TadB